MVRLLRERNFALLWFGGLISLIGDRAMMTALPFYVYQQTGSTLQTAALFTAYYLPMVLFGSVAGVFVDRWDRRWIMVVANFVQAVVMLMLLLVRSDAWLWLVYCVAFVQTTAAMFFGPAESAIVPNLVDERDLVPANTLGNLNNSLARLVGPPIGGVLLGWFGLGGVVLIDSASFLIAGLMTARISVSGRASAPPAHSAVTEQVVSSWLAVWHEWRAGLRLVRHDRLLLPLFVVATVTSFGGSLIDPLFVPFAESVLRVDSSALGMLLTTGAAGGLTAALIVGRWGRTLPPRSLTAYGTVIVGAFMLVMYNQQSLPVVMALNFLMFVPVVASGVGLQTMFQRGVSDHFRGRVFGALNTTIALVGLVSLWLAGVLAEIFGIVTMLSVAGGVTIIAGVLAFALLPHNEATEDTADEAPAPSPS